MWQSWVEIQHISTALLHSKHCSAELPLRVGLIRTTQTYVLMEVLRYRALNAVTWWNCTTE